MSAKTNGKKRASAKTPLKPTRPDTREVRVMVTHLLRNLPDSLKERTDILQALFCNLPKGSSAWCLASRLVLPLLHHESDIDMTLQNQFGEWP